MMGTHFNRRIAITVAAAVLASMTGALAQGASPQANSTVGAPAQNGQVPPPPENGSPENHTDWKNEKFERQELREEMEQIRRDHEDLESARDSFMEKCGGKEPPPPDCELQKQALHDRHEQLHERTLALREKIQSARREHSEEYSMKHSSWPHDDHGTEQLNGQPPTSPQTATGQAQQPAPPPPR
jgi:hypothetical protein